MPAASGSTVARATPADIAAPVDGPMTDASQNFRFYDNRQNYLLFVNTCSEKWVVAERVARELEQRGIPFLLHSGDLNRDDETVRRLGVQSLRDQLCHSFVIDRARPPWSKLVIQPWEPIPRIPRAPLVDRVAIDPQCRRNVSAGLVRPFACQDDARAQRQRCWK